MSLYELSKLLYVLNREEAAKKQYQTEPEAFAARFSLTDEERTAVLDRDVGKIYVLGVNGQILMHFGALCGFEWSDYLQRLRDGVKRYGPVRAGIYAMTTDIDEKIVGA